MSAAAQLKKETAAATRDRHQRKFRLLWRCLCPDLPIMEEVQFGHGRSRLDFAHTVARVGIEIQGGIWTPGRGHNSGEGITRDCAKARAALFLGWVIFPLTSADIEAGLVLRLRDYIRARAIDKADPYREAR